MSEISYFAKYSQRENQITNNTILMFRHLYNESPKLFNDFLSSLLQEQIEFGVNFSQQVKESDSIPDALISQNANNIYFEFKLKDFEDEHQIKNHIASIKESNNSNSILLYVTVNRIPEKDYDLPVFFITYVDIVENLEFICPEYLYNLREIIDDYQNVLSVNNLLPIKYQMVAVPCGRTWERCFKFRNYVNSMHRHFRKNTKYIGIYNDKKIKYIGRISDKVKVKNSSEFLDYDTEKPTTDINIINKAKEIMDNFPKDKSFDRNYYFFDEMYEVNIDKSSKGGMQSIKYFDLLKDFGEIKKDSFESFEQLCNILKGRSFE